MIRLFVLLICLFPTWVSAALLFSQDWSAGNTWGHHGACYPYSLKVVPNACTPGDNVMRVRNIMGDDNGNCTGTFIRSTAGNCPTGETCFPYRHRAETVPKFPDPHPNRQDPGQEFWFGFRIFVPSNYPTTSITSFIVSQSIPPSGANGVDWDLRIHSNGHWTTTLRRTDVGAPRNDLLTDHGAIQRNAWTNWVFRYKRSTNSTGVWQVWKNDQLQVLDTER